MELNLSRASIEAAGVGLAAILPDPVESLAAFADRHGIGYPLLADEGGAVIERYGLTNPNIPRDHPVQRPGTPFAGHLLLAPDGSVVAKAFTGDLRHRPAGSTLVLEHVARAGQPGIEVRTDEVRAEIVVAAARLFAGQEVAVVIDLDIDPGWHLYAGSVPAPYTGLSVELEPDGAVLLDRWSVEEPPARELHLPELGETLPVHERRITLRGRARLRWSPPPSRFAELADAVATRAVPPGRYELAGVLRYQACDDATCLAPRSVPFTIPVVVEPPPAG